jgi:hypothetical protein
LASGAAPLDHVFKLIARYRIVAFQLKRDDAFR